MILTWGAQGAVAGAVDDPIFVDRAAEWGLDFVHFNGMTGQFYFPEMTGQGGAFLDYDRDGDLDLYLVQGALLGPDEELGDALAPPPAGVEPIDRLYRNDLSAAGVRLVDVTQASGLQVAGHGMGAAVGDYDRDGFEDLYITQVGPNRLLRARGDGTFEDATEAAGVADPLWSTSAAFFDYDADGWLDLYVVNYVEFDLVRNPRCFATSSRRDYCGPSSFRPLPDRLLRNRGDGTFENVLEQALAGYAPGPGLGVVAGDFSGDGRLDIYVANDGAVNQMWINQGDGRFAEEALLAGVAVNREGRAEASMGVAAGDFDLDGDEDLFMTHLMGETNTLYVNLGAGMFEDRTVESGLAGASLPYTSFGTGWLDFDNDGRQDLVVMNGAVRILEEQAAAGDPYPLKQPNQLFHNREQGFVEVSDRAGVPFQALEVSRGVGFGDVDRDGDADLAQFNNNSAARLLENRVGQRNAWLGLAAVRPGGAPAVGVSFAVERGDGARLRLRTRTDGSYCSASEPRAIAGLGQDGRVRSVEVSWPGGAAQRWLSLPDNRYLAFYDPVVPERAP